MSEIIDELNDSFDTNSKLRSKAYAKIVDLVCEGEIEGLVDGLKSVYLNETPVENSDGSLNFENLHIETREGTNAQSYIEGYDSVENTVTVGAEVTNALPLVRRITNTGVNAVKVIIQIPALYEQTTTGLNGNSVKFKIEIQANGGGYTTLIEKTITGKTANSYERMFRINLTGDAPWDIRVTKVSDDVFALDLQNNLYFKSYTEVIDSKLRYPNSALIAMKINAAQFQNIPSRAYDLKLLKIKIPSNYNPITKVYTGVWDGLFKTDKEWSDNPAWVYYDILTNSRYGLGEFVDATQIDKWALYEIAQYCDEEVDDGFGGFESRFTCNLYLQSQEEAYKVLNDLTTVFRGLSYWSSGGVTLIQDAPKDAEYLFTNANVVDGIFNYQGAVSKAKHTVALVAYNDADDFYKQKIEYVEDVVAVAEYGIISTEVFAIGCTSRGQAHRLGKWILYTEQNESKILNFKAGSEGALLRPGMIIQVADELVAGDRLGGRIAAATASSVTLDGDYDLPTTSGTISVVLPSGVVETKDIVLKSGRVVTIAGTFSETPTNPSVWMISTPTLEVQTFRVLTVAESKEGIYEVTSMAHDSRKFDAIEQDIVLEPRDYTNLNPIPVTPSNLSVVESLFEFAGQVKTRATFSWDEGADGVTYEVTYSRRNDNELITTQILSPSYDLIDTAPGIYDFAVVAINVLGKRSAKATYSKELYGKTSPPVDVSGFSILPNISNVAVLTWDRATDLDVLIGGQVRIRWTPMANPEWNDAIDIIEALAGTSTSANVPLLEGSYMAKFIDSSGNESVNTAEIYTTVPYGNAINAVHTETEDPAFAGVKVGCEYSASYGGLILSGTGLIDDVVDWDLLDDIDFLGALYEEATYNFQNTVDLGAVYPSRITAYLNVEAFDVDDFIDSRVEPIDAWLDFDGNAITDVYAKLYMRTTEDDPGGSPTWTDWKPFFIGEYTARGYEFYLHMSTDNLSHNIVIKDLEITIDMPDRTESQRNLVSGPGAYSATYPYPFWETPSIVITAYNMGTGDYFEVGSQTEAGFSVTFRNSGGTAVSRTFDYVAKGYGREIP